MRQALQKHPGKRLHQISIGIAGFWIIGIVINIFSNYPNQLIINNLEQGIDEKISKTNKN